MEVFRSVTHNCESHVINFVSSIQPKTNHVADPIQNQDHAHGHQDNPIRFNLKSKVNFSKDVNLVGRNENVSRKDTQMMTFTHQIGITRIVFVQMINLWYEKLEIEKKEYSPDDWAYSNLRKFWHRLDFLHTDQKLLDRKVLWDGLVVCTSVCHVLNVQHAM